MNTSETLYLAADLIETHGWGHGILAWAERGEGLCLEGALAAALGVEDPSESNDAHDAFRSCPAYQAVLEQIGPSSDLVKTGPFGNPEPLLWRWNDRPHRTASEVIGVLRAAAVVEAARESQPSVAVA